MALSQAALIDIRDTCNEIVSMLNAADAVVPGMTPLEVLGRVIASCAASVQCLADMVRTLAEEAARG